MRVKRGKATKKKHKKVLKHAKGYVGSKSKLFKSANQAVSKAWRYAYRHRRQKKREFRSLWIARINAACKEYGISYSRFIHALNKAKITVNRKIISDIAINDKKGFENLIKLAKVA